MSSPWAQIKTPDVVNFEDILSEEVAKGLQSKEDAAYAKYMNQHCAIKAPQVEDDSLPLDEAIQTDAAIAGMLQRQFDKEHDDVLRKTENKYNGQSKVTVSYTNYRRIHENPNDSDSSEPEEPEDIADRKDWDRFDTNRRAEASMPRCGYMKNEDGDMVTKHDITMCSRKNTCRFMSFPPEFQTGDGASFDLKLSNKVFNSLKAYSRTEQSRRHRLHDRKEEHATAEFGLDQFTRILLHKIINKGLLERINGIISIGKEAVVLHAEGNVAYDDIKIPKDVVIKVFKTTLSQFKQRDRYINDDHRFKDRIGKQNSRKTVNLWVEKEMRNLMRVNKCGLPCPQVICLKKHTLVMSMIGEDEPAPKLKDVELDAADFRMAYEQVVDGMKKMYSEANLIHADLSEYNILYYSNRCWFIDMSQSVEPMHNNAYNFLMRDCNNITKFFSRLEGIKTAEELFHDITGFQFNNV